MGGWTMPNYVTWAIADVATCRDDVAWTGRRPEDDGDDEGAQPMTATLQDAVAQIVAESRMSLSQFSREADVSRKQLERILAGESARPHDHTLRRIAAVVGRDGRELLAVRDHGTPLPSADGDDQSALEARIADLEGEVAQIRALLTEVRDGLMRPHA